MDQEPYVITDGRVEVIRGVVEASSEPAALSKVISDPNGTLFDGERGAREIEARLLYELIDGQWREVAPLGAAPQGDCGGDIQVSNAFSRRFAQVRPGGLWAVITLSWYAINETVEFVDRHTKGEVIEQQTQFEIVDDLRDLDQTLWHSDEYIKLLEFDPTDAGAVAAADSFTIANIIWDGDEIR
jgi:hypothetical protein